MRLDGSSQTMLILVGDSNGQQLWTSGAGVAITTSAQDGRILRTAGFQHNLGGYAPGTNIVSQDGVRTVRWQGDFPNLKLYSVDMTCRDRPAGDETIIILGKDIHTKRIDESCVSNGNRLDWSFENIYWIDPDNGLVWRSIQHVNPMLDAIELEILRPPPEH